MGEATISVKEVFSEIHNRDIDGKRKPFSISFFTYNKQKRTGGELKQISKATSCALPKKLNAKKNLLLGIRDLKNEKHDTTIHWPLIYKFNGKIVMF